MVYIKKKGIDPDISHAASLMGKKGGKSKSPKKLEAIAKNALEGGRPAIYSYAKKVSAVLGSRHKRKCIIPDEVAKAPNNFTSHSFPAFWAAKRINVRIRFIDDDGVLHVTRC